jgi:hypothetical protein
MKRILLILTTTVILAAAPAFSQNLGDIQNAAEDLVDALAVSLPFNSTVGLNWSDAYIGQLVGAPPHFGVGVTVGTTTIDAGAVTAIMSELGYDISGFDTYIPLPVVTTEARIGGFVLPFDIGIKAGYIPEGVVAIDNVKFNYLLAGADIRYAVLKGGLVLPKVSIGVGFNYMRGGLGTSVGSTQTYSFDDPNNGDVYTINATKPDIGLNWETTVIDLKAQISKSFIIFTPYAGLGASYGMTTVGYEVDSTVTYKKNGVTTDPQNVEQALEDAGYDAPDLSSSGMSYEKALSAWGFRAFGGFSVNMLLVRLDLNGLYNFSDGQLGGSVGVRVQL